jgi:hypothetical protein
MLIFLIHDKMAFLLKGLLGIGGSSQVSAESQSVKNGDLMIQLDPESKQISFSIMEDNNHKPIVFDLANGVIYNARFA